MTVAPTSVAALAARAELGWRDPSGLLHAAVIVPLAVDRVVVAALPFSRTALARDLQRTGAATLVLSDPRMAWRGWSAGAVTVGVTVEADREGAWTRTGALDQEVRKHTPSRYLVDTPIQRREHWWYVPRWVVRLEPVGRWELVGRRAGPEDGVLFSDDAEAPSARTVGVDGWDAGSVALSALDARPWSAGPVPGLLCTHDFSIPDQERASIMLLTGRRRGNRFDVRARSGSRELEPLGGVWRRLARHRRLERDCRRALAAYDASLPAAT